MTPAITTERDGCSKHVKRTEEGILARLFAQREHVNFGMDLRPSSPVVPAAHLARRWCRFPTRRVSMSGTSFFVCPHPQHRAVWDGPPRV